MTFLVFSINGRRFAIPASDVVTVVPMVPLREIDGTPDWVAGVLPFFGDVVPVLDVCRLHVARASRRAFASRIMLVRYPTAGGDVRTLGLLAEGVTDIADVAADAWRAVGFATPETPWLGPVADVGGGVLAQRIAVSDLLPPDVRERLFP